MVFRTLLLYYTKSAHVKQAFSHRLRRIFQNLKCAFSEKKFPKVGKKWKRVRYLPFFKKSVHSIPAGKNRSKHIFSGVFEFFFSKKVSILLRANRKKTKTIFSFFGISCFLLQI
jgi:hypothetical protein